MMKKIFVFLFDGFSDWEIAFLTPEINKSEQFDLVYFSLHGNQVKSMGGLQVNPTTSLHEIQLEEIDLLILPGGTAWENGQNKEIEKFTAEVFKKGKPIAAICAATAFLGQLGFLNNLIHTSNHLDYLKAVAPKYSGDDYYQNTMAVADKNIITANGIAPIEFSKEIFKLIGLYNEENIEKWFQLFKNGIWVE